MQIWNMTRLAILSVSMVSMCIFTYPALAQDAIVSQHAVETALESAILCEYDGLNIFSGTWFGVDGESRKPRLASLGVEIIEDPENTGEMRYRFPPGVKVFGYEAIEVRYSAPSSTIFFVNLRAGVNRLPALSKLLKLNPVPKGNPDGYGYFNEFQASYIRKLHAVAGMRPDTIFAAKLNQQNTIVVGCQNLSW